MNAHWLLLCLACLLCSGGCRSDPRPKQELVVFAAASLREAFTEIREEFRRTHPQVEVVFNFAGSQELRSQIEHGAPADVFASADPEHMRALMRAGHAEPARVFARNELVVVAAQKARTLRQFGDLDRAERVVVGAAEVPVGRYTQRVLDRAGRKLGAEWRARVDARIVSRELNVRQVLAKVRLGEADAGIVYESDARAVHGAVRTIEIPRDINETAEYPLAVLAAARQPGPARAWAELVLSRAGQRILEHAGFLPPSSSHSK